MPDMETVVGVFKVYQTARDAAVSLRLAGFSEKQVNLLCPSSSEEEIHTIATSDTEQPGVGGAIGGMLGGALGVAGGLELGMAATALLIPGVGPVLAFGLVGAALFGAAGAAGGAALGNAADDQSNAGVPSDEIFFYEDALRHGRSIVLVLAVDHSEEKRAHKLLADAGAESLDAAQKDWWLGLRDAEQEHYQALGHNFELDEDVYRAGFNSALRRECRGRSLDEQADCLKWFGIPSRFSGGSSVASSTGNGKPPARRSGRNRVRPWQALRIWANEGDFDGLRVWLLACSARCRRLSRR